MSKIKNIRDLELFDFTGTVIDQQNWVEMTTTTTTSGGHVNQGTGHVSSPTTTTSRYSTEKLRMFLRLDSGREEEITLNDAGFGVRPGHRVSVIYAKNRADTHGHAVAAYDHSTQATKIYESAIRDVIANISFPVGCLMLMAISTFAGVLSTLAVSLALLVFYVGGGGVIVWMVSKRRREKALQAAINGRVREEITRLRENEGRSTNAQ